MTTSSVTPGPSRSAASADVIVVGAGPGGAATGLIFADDASSLRRTLAENEDALNKPAQLWVAYPKANRTDINGDTLWPILIEYGMRPNGQIAIDEVWSALRFRPNKPGERPLTGGAKG